MDFNFKQKEKNKTKLKEETATSDNQLAKAKSAAGTHAAKHAAMVAGDIFRALWTDRTAQMFMVILVLSLVFWEVSPVSYVLYPFKLFVTIIHEACHAMAARFTGGNVTFISIAADHSGLTSTMGGFQLLVMMAGYLGTSIFGGLLIYWGRNPKAARFILNSIGTVILALTIFYGGGGPFSFIAMLLIGAAILFVSRKATDKVCHLFLLMLAVQTTLEAVISIQDLFLISVLNNSAHSDAKNLEGVTGIPALVWSVFFAVVSVLVLIYSFWISYRKPKVKPESPPEGPKQTTLSS